MKTILVPVDFSEISSKTAATAFSLVQDIHVKLIFVHVSDPSAKTPDLDVKARLRSLVESAADQGIVASSRLVKGNAVQQILAQAEDLRADIIVMGSHDRESLRGSSIGSTARGVLEVTPCPLLIVPSEKAKTERLRRRGQSAASAV